MLEVITIIMKKLTTFGKKNRKIYQRSNISFKKVRKIWKKYEEMIEM